LPLATITAWEGLVDRAQISEGCTVLVHGAGGVGRIAIQIARAFGARVWATGRAAHAETIARLGATSIDFEAEAVNDYVARHAAKGFDVVYDTIGGSSLDVSFAAVRRFGHVVSAMGWGTHALAPLSFKAATYSGVYTLIPLQTGEGRAHHGEILEQARQLVEAGLLLPGVDPRCFTFADIEAAYAAVAEGKAAGKVVVSPPPHR
jgi:NADPH:quinone reductase-like Zn-dependent oxidoreductase